MLKDFCFPGIFNNNAGLALTYMSSGFSKEGEEGVISRLKQKGGAVKVEAL